MQVQFRVQFGSPDFHVAQVPILDLGHRTEAGDRVGTRSRTSTFDEILIFGSISGDFQSADRASQADSGLEAAAVLRFQIRVRQHFMRKPTALNECVDVLLGYRRRAETGYEVSEQDRIFACLEGQAQTRRQVVAADCVDILSRRIRVEIQFIRLRFVVEIVVAQPEREAQSFFGEQDFILDKYPQQVRIAGRIALQRIHDAVASRIDFARREMDVPVEIDPLGGLSDVIDAPQQFVVWPFLAHDYAGGYEVLVDIDFLDVENLFSTTRSPFELVLVDRSLLQIDLPVQPVKSQNIGHVAVETDPPAIAFVLRVVVGDRSRRVQPGTEAGVNLPPPDIHEHAVLTVGSIRVFPLEKDVLLRSIHRKILVLAVNPGFGKLARGQLQQVGAAKRRSRIAEGLPETIIDLVETAAEFEHRIVTAVQHLGGRSGLQQYHSRQGVTAVQGGRRSLQELDAVHGIGLETVAPVGNAGRTEPVGQSRPVHEHDDPVSGKSANHKTAVAAAVTGLIEADGRLVPDQIGQAVRLQVQDIFPIQNFQAGRRAPDGGFLALHLNNDFFDVLRFGEKGGPAGQDK